MKPLDVRRLDVSALRAIFELISYEVRDRAVIYLNCQMWDLIRQHIHDGTLAQVKQDDKHASSK